MPDQIKARLFNGEYLINAATAMKHTLPIATQVRSTHMADRTTKVTLIADTSAYVAAMNEAAEATQRLIDLKKQLDNDEA